MSKENKYKTLQEKLDEMNQVPSEFHFQQQAVWNKLEDSLQHKKASLFFPIWMRYAAAAIIIVTVGSWIFYSNTNLSKDLAKSIPVSTNKKIIPAQNKSRLLLPVQTNIEERIAINKDAKKSFPAHASLKNNQAITNPSPSMDQLIDKNETLVSVLESPKTILSPATEINNTPVLIVNNSTTIATNKKPSSKRLPVIHINEISMLEQPVVSKSNNKHASLIETEEPFIAVENNKTWWWPKPKPINTTPPITALTDNQ